MAAAGAAEAAPGVSSASGLLLEADAVGAGFPSLAALAAPATVPGAVDGAGSLPAASDGATIAIGRFSGAAGRVAGCVA